MNYWEKKSIGYCNLQLETLKESQGVAREELEGKTWSQEHNFG